MLRSLTTPRDTDIFHSPPRLELRRATALSLSHMEQRILYAYFGWELFNLFLGGVLSGSVVRCVNRTSQQASGRCNWPLLVLACVRPALVAAAVLGCAIGVCHLSRMPATCDAASLWSGASTTSQQGIGGCN